MTLTTSVIIMTFKDMHGGEKKFSIKNEKLSSKSLWKLMELNVKFYFVKKFLRFCEI